MIIRIDYPQVAVRLDLWGGTSGTFAGLDQFNRVIDQRWQNNTSGTPADIDRYQYGYDRDSNRMWKANVVGTPIVTGGLDEYYTYDRVNRLNQMQRGTLNSTKTGITGTPSREMDWTLDPTGNWPGYLTKTSGTTDLDQGRTSSKVNEITNISESTGPTWVTPAYDAAGNMTTMPQVADPTLGFTATYDAWNRMTGISASGTQVAKYQYDGRNRRIVKETYTGGTLSETRHFYFTNAWQDVEERVGSSTSMDRQYAWGVRYVDELVCRDDATPLRLYACQDGHMNVTALADTSGVVQERFVYDPYGSDVVLNGSWGSTTDTYAWTCRFTGRQYDSESRLYSNRSRTYLPHVGTFSTRDDIGYLSDINLYAYVHSRPTITLDPYGYEIMIGIQPADPTVGPEMSIFRPTPSIFDDIAEWFRTCPAPPPLPPAVDAPPITRPRWGGGAPGPWRPAPRPRPPIPMTCPNPPPTPPPQTEPPPASDTECKKKDKWKCTTKPRHNCPPQCNHPYVGYGSSQGEAKDAAEAACAADGCNTPGGKPYNCQCAHTTCTEKPN